MIDAGGMAILAQNAQSAQIQGLINALESQPSGQNHLAQYAKLGQNIMRLSGVPEPGTSSDPVFGGADLTGGFDMDWMSKRLSAGSADGAAIG